MENPSIAALWIGKYGVLKLKLVYESCQFAFWVGCLVHLVGGGGFVLTFLIFILKLLLLGFGVFFSGSL